LAGFVGLNGKVEIWKGKSIFYFTFPWVSDFKNNSSCPVSLFFTFSREKNPAFITERVLLFENK
jgi:hypothetical protein